MSRLTRMFASIVTFALGVATIVVAAPMQVHADRIVVDTGWGADGTVDLPSVFDDGYTQVAASETGSVYLARASGTHDITIARLDEAGVLDTGFDSDGLRTVTIPGTNFYGVSSVYPFSDDRVLVFVGEGYDDLYLYMFEDDGSLDSSFGTSGVVALTVPSPLGYWDSDPVIDSGERIYIPAYGYYASDLHYWTLRVTASGSIDTTFDTDGWLEDALAQAATPTGDKVYVATGALLTDGHLERLLSSGAIDSSFTASDLPWASYVVAHDNGKVTTYGGTYPDLWLTYYLDDGTLDPSRPAVPMVADYHDECTCDQFGMPAWTGAGRIFFSDDRTVPHRIWQMTSYGTVNSDFGDDGYATIDDDDFYYVRLTADTNGRPLALWIDDPGGTPIAKLTRFLATDPEPFTADPVTRTGAPVGGMTVVDPVDTATGNLTGSWVDLAGGAFGLNLVRSYNSLAPEATTLGSHWRLSTGPEAVADGTDVVVLAADGTRFRYQPDGVGGYVTPDGTADALEEDPASPTGGGGLPMLRLAYADGRVDRFDTLGRLIEQTDWTGQSATVAFDGSGRVDTITSSTGLGLAFTYSVGGLVTSVSTSTGLTVEYGYDLAGLLTTVTDEHGGVTTIDYTPSGWLETMTDPSGVVLEDNTYDVDGRVIEQVGPGGASTSFRYMVDESVTEVTHHATGETLTYHHDSVGKVIAIVDSLGHSVRRVFDEDANITGTLGRTDAETSATYDGNHNLLSITEDGVGTTEYEYDGLNRVVETTDPWGAVTSYTYDGAERIPSTVTDALSHTTTYDVVDGLVTSVTDADGVTITNTYDSARRLLTVTDDLSNTTTYTYDGAGRRASVESPGGRSTSYAYGPNGRLDSVTAPDGGVTSYTYDDAGRVLTTTDPTLAVTTNTYDTAGNVIEVEGPNGEVTEYEHDTAGQLISSTAPAAASSTGTTYGPMGRVMAETDVFANDTAFEYDDDGRPTLVTDRSGGETETVYDEAGRVVSTTDPAGRETTTVYDAHGRVDSVVGPDEATTEYTYDLLGRTVTVTDPRGGVTTTTYTDGGRVETVTDPAGLTTSYGYDAAGQRSTVTAPGSLTTTTTYTDDGDVDTVTSPGGLVTAYTYDDAGRVETITDPAGVVTDRTWSLRGELLTETVGAEGTKVFTYNPDGTMATATDAVGKVTAFYYDERGNMISRTNAMSGVDQWVFDDADQMIESIDPLNRSTTYDYDEAGRVIETIDPSGVTIDTTYNQDGTLATRDNGVEVITYAYDDAGRIASLTTPSMSFVYTYNGAGDLTSSTLGDRVTTWTYDDAGRRTAMRYPDGNSILYDYNAAGHLDTITPGELLADSFTQANATVPTTFKWSRTLTSGGTALVQSNALVLNVTNTSGSSAVVNSKLANASDHDISFRYQFASVAAGNVVKFTAFIKQTSTNQYRLEFQSGSSTATVYQKVGATTTTLGTVTVPNTTAATRMRFQAAGTAIKVKVWADGTDEPSSWTSTLSSTGFATTGNARISATRISGTNSITIDDWKQTNPSSPPVPLAEYTYDNDGNITEVDLVGGDREYTYTDSQLVELDETLPGLTRDTTLTYDTTGRIATETTGSLVTTYGYDNASQLTSATPTTGDTSTWTYDDLGRRTTQTIGATTTRYKYDAAGQLCWTKTGSPSANNCTTPPSGATTFTYDDAGRLTNETRSASSTFDFTYDNAGRLTEIDRLNFAVTTHHERTYRPDGLLANIDNTRTDASGTTNDTYTLGWDYLDGIPELTELSEDANTRNLVTGPAGWVSTTLGLDTDAIGQDIHGSAIPTTGTGLLARSSAYTAFGEPSGSNVFEPRLGYRGELNIDNQLYLRARDYHAHLARFSTRDPSAGIVGAATTAEPYHYSDNNPPNRFDPTGKTTDEVFTSELPQPDQELIMAIYEQTVAPKFASDDPSMVTPWVSMTLMECVPHSAPTLNEPNCEAEVWDTGYRQDAVPDNQIRFCAKKVAIGLELGSNLCATGFRNSDEAKAFASQFQNQQGLGNAIQHALWFALNRFDLRDEGDDALLNLGWAHEQDYADSYLDTARDMANNRIGLSIGDWYRQAGGARATLPAFVKTIADDLWCLQGDKTYGSPVRCKNR
jgi:RHS repeat-associated protein